MTRYTKPHLPVSDQIALLQKRGMLITDTAKASDALHRIGYYRLSGYWHPMRISVPSASGGAPVFQDDFKPSSEFAHVIDLYVFDKKLRLLMLDAIERVEIGLRVEMALLMSKRSPWAHRLPAEVHSRFVTPPRPNAPSHADWLQRLDRTAQSSREEFVGHFRSKYSDPLPMWMAVELWDFGSLSIFLSGMKDADLNILSNYFRIPRRELLTSWVRSINNVRNICAHHGRLWNRVMTDRPKPPRLGEMPDLDHLATSVHSHNRLYSVAVALRWFLSTINPGTAWSARLQQHFQTFPQCPHYHLSQTGFPAGWDSLPYW